MARSPAPPRRWLMRFLIVVAVGTGLVLFPAVIERARLALPAWGCASEQTQAAVSPDGRYVAEVFQSNCGATTSFGTGVMLRDVGNWSFLRPQTVFGYVGKGTPAELQVSWATNRQLVIMHSCDYILAQNTRWWEVSIRYHKVEPTERVYCKDKPVYLPPPTRRQRQLLAAIEEQLSAPAWFTTLTDSGRFVRLTEPEARALGEQWVSHEYYRDLAEDGVTERFHSTRRDRSYTAPQHRPESLAAGTSRTGWQAAFESWQGTKWYIVYVDVIVAPEAQAP